MPQVFLNEREFELINIVGAQLPANQRDLSRRMNLSLGMTNMLLRRLVSKGYIRINQLNPRKFQYLLTSKGFTEKMRKSVKYTLKTINNLSLIKNRLSAVISHLHQQGHRQFWVLGTSDFAMLIEMSVKEMKLADCHIHYIDQWQDQSSQDVVLICKEETIVEGKGDLTVINLIHELAKDDAFMQRDGAQL